MEPRLTSRWRISVALLGVVATFIPSVHVHGLFEVAFRRVVGAGEVLAGSPDLADGDGGDGHEQHDS